MSDVGEVKKGDWWRLSEEEFRMELHCYALGPAEVANEAAEKLLAFHRESLAALDRCRDALSRHMDREMDRRGA